MSSVAPAVEPVAPARTSGLTAIFEHTRYVLGENRVTAFAFALLIVIVFAALFGPYIVPYDPLASDTAAALKPPSSAHWFGTDQLGRDIFSRVIVATRLDTFIAVCSVVLVFLMGGLAGVAAGYFGGWTDRIGCRMGHHGRRGRRLYGLGRMVDRAVPGPRPDDRGVLLQPSWRRAARHRRPAAAHVMMRDPPSPFVIAGLDPAIHRGKRCFEFS